MKKKYLVEAKSGGWWRTDDQRYTLFAAKKLARTQLVVYRDESVRIQETRVVMVVAEFSSAVRS